MLSSLFYPLPFLFSFFTGSDSAMLWTLLFLSAGLNIYLIKRNKKLNSQLNSQLKTQQPVSKFQEPVQNTDNDIFYDSHHLSSQPVPDKQAQSASKELSTSSLRELEMELDNNIWLDDPCEKQDIDSEIIPQLTESVDDSLMQNVLQSLSGWHKSLVPFLLQNIGWFIGVFSFISGSVFFISYTEGFTKTVTIFYTILSYTILLAWGGYRLKDKVAHASISGSVLMAISFLLIPLNFSAAVRLISNSLGSIQTTIAAVSIIVSLVSLYYVSKLISGVFNRQLLTYFSSIFYALSTIQLIVPVVQNSQSMLVLLLVQTIILLLLLSALIAYLPVLLKQVFVDRKYLLLFCVGSLIYSALVSTIHITLSSSMTIALSYYAPILMLISGALFYMDEQLNEYKTQNSLLSRFSFISYAVSFTAIFLSLDSELIRIVTLLLGSVLYTRLLWSHRTLIPLYLVVLILCFLHFDVLLSMPVLNVTTAYQWYYLLSLPLLGLFSAALILLRKSEIRRIRRFGLTSHLFHFIILASMMLSVFSLWFSTTANSALGTSIAVFVSSYYLLRSEQISAAKLLGLKIYSGYLYLLLFLPLVLVLLSPADYISIDIKMLIITMITLFYSLNSHFNFLNLYRMGRKGQQFNQELFVNSTLLVMLLLMVLVGMGFTLSIKIGLLLFILSLNCLFLSFSLYNRALFYAFIAIVSLSALVIKLYLHSSPSTGLFIISFAFVLFYLIHWLDRKRTDEIELLRSEANHKNSPDKILWCYPVNDFSVNDFSINVRPETSQTEWSN